ncbi:MAG: hypothetical protein B6241_12205 [Spirochaetaceae bacterium 4572_59]|nr:MAG: hypothetical protein B6241_12205 [Spirochaetaceae bacterium 4572_59]
MTLVIMAIGMIASGFTVVFALARKNRIGSSFRFYMISLYFYPNTLLISSGSLIVLLFDKAGNTA